MLNFSTNPYFRLFTSSSCISSWNRTCLKTKVKITSVTAWKTVALLGIEGPADYFKSNPFKTSLGLFNQTSSFVSLLTQWRQFVSWFQEFVKLDGHVLIFPNPLTSKYSSLVTLGSTPLTTIEWSHVTNLCTSHLKRRSFLFRHFMKYRISWRDQLCVFPDIIVHHATASNLSRRPLFSLGLVPLSYVTHGVTYPLFVFDASLTIQLFFINLLRHLYSL